MSRPALGSTWPSVQWVLGALSLGVKSPGHEANQSPPASAKFKNDQSCTPLPHMPSWHIQGQLSTFYYKGESNENLKSAIKV